MDEFARSLADVALMRAASIGGDPAALDLTDSAGLRIGVCRTEVWSEALPESVAMLAEAAEILADADATVSDIEPPSEVPEAMVEFPTILCTEDSRAISADVGDRVDRINSWAQKSIRDAKDVTPAQYDNAKALAERARIAMDAVFDNFDVLITPSTRGDSTDRSRPNRSRPASPLQPA